MSDIATIVEDLETNYDKQKYYDNELKTSRQKFFNTVTEEINETEPLATKLVSIPDDKNIRTDRHVKQWINQNYPGWQIKETTSYTGGPLSKPAFKVLLEEDPDWKPYTYEYNGRTFRRNVVEGAPSIDDEALAIDHPAVWERLSEPDIPDLTLVRYFIEDTVLPEEELDPDKILEVWSQVRDWPRKLKPLEEADPQDLEIMADYMVPGKLSYRLEIRDVKDDG